MELITRRSSTLILPKKLITWRNVPILRQPRWHAALNQTIRQLLRHPFLGRQRTDLNPSGIRSWRVNHFRRWLVFYSVRDDAVVLLRVRYGMMDLPMLKF